MAKTKFKLFGRLGGGWRRLLSVLAAVLSLAACASVDAAQLASTPPPPEKLLVSVAPQFTAVRIQRVWTPVLNRLTALTGVKFELRHYPTIPSFEVGFSRGESDLVYLGPYHAVTAMQTQGYVPLWHDTTPLSGILVVRRDSPLHTLDDLAGAHIAFPAPNSFGASLYLRGLLDQKGIKIIPSYVQTHQNVYRSVLMGDTVAGGGVKRTLSNETASVQSQLRILFETPSVAPHPVVAHPRVSAALRGKLLAAILTMAAGPDRALLAEVGFEAPVAADYTRDYAPLAKLGLERYLLEGDGSR